VPIFLKHTSLIAFVKEIPHLSRGIFFVLRNKKSRLGGCASSGQTQLPENIFDPRNNSPANSLSQPASQPHSAPHGEMPVLDHD
jgi:hypothetical protein